MDADTRRIVEESLRSSGYALARGLTVAGADEVARFVVDQVSEATQASFTFVSELVGPGLSSASMLAIRSRVGTFEPFAYPLEGTPCGDVIFNEVCLHLEGVARRFPADEILANQRIEAYCGARLVDADDRPLGHLATLYRGPLDLETAHAHLAVLRAWCPRMAAELAHRRAVRDLRSVLEVSASSGEEALLAMAEALTQVLGVKGAFAVGLIDGVPMLRALFFSGLRHAETLLPGHPIARRRVPFRATEVLPGHPLVRMTKAFALIEEPIELEGRTIGAVGLLHDRPFLGDLAASSVFSAYRRRVGLELGRIDAEGQRRREDRALSAEERRASLARLAGGVAHDFNNLLVSMLGNAQLLAEELEGEPREVARDITAAVRRATDLSRKLVAYAGQSGVPRAPVELGRLVQQVAASMTGLVPAGSELEVRVAPGPHPVVGDVTHLEQLVANLLANALQALKRRPGRALIELTEVHELPPRSAAGFVFGPRLAEDRATGGAPYVCLTVSDEGVGIPDEVLPRIFEPFFTTKPDAHGLGLAATLGIVEDHEGTLTVRTKEGVGTLFRVYLPRDPSLG